MKKWDDLSGGAGLARTSQTRRPHSIAENKQKKEKLDQDMPYSPLLQLSYIPIPWSSLDINFKSIAAVGCHMFEAWMLAAADSNVLKIGSD